MEPSIKKVDWFDREHIKGDLKGRSVKGGIRTVGAQIFSFTINVVTTIFLARLLLPEDYGLVAMVTSFTGFILIFKDLGLTQAIIQQDYINQQVASKLFWFNVYVSIILALIIIALGPLLVWFYEEDRLLWISAVYALTAVFGGLSAQHSALLSRQMDFKALSSITISASFVSLVVALIMAYVGFGYWALVAISVLNAAVTALLLWIKCDWRPDRSKLDKSIIPFINFGAGITGFNIINYFSRNLDNILIGRMLGSVPLGLYSKAYQLLMLPITQLRDPLNSVGIPAMSSLTSNPEKYRKYYREYLFLLSFFSMPTITFLFVTAEDIILFLLGANWIEAATIFKLLAITAFIQPIASTRGMVMISSGKTTRYFFWGLWNAVFVTAAFFIGIQYGLNGLAIAYAIVNYAILVPSLMYCFNGTPVSVFDFFKTIAFAAIISVLSATAVWLAHDIIINLMLWLRILIYVILYSGIYFGIWLLLPQTRRKLFSIIDLAKSLINKKL